MRSLPSPSPRRTCGRCLGNGRRAVLKALLGLALVAIAGWMPAQRLFEVSSVEAVVNARLVTVRAPINGDRPARRSQPRGRRIDRGRRAAGDGRRTRGSTQAAPMSPSNSSAMPRRNGRRCLQSWRTRKPSAMPCARSLRVFRDNRIRQIEAELAEGDARIASAAAEQHRADAIRATSRACSPGKARWPPPRWTTPTATRSLRRPRSMRPQASRAVLAVELAALKSGGYLGDDYNDQPRSAQRIDELDQSIAAIEADIARLEPADWPQAVGIARARSSARHWPAKLRWPHRSAVRSGKSCTASWRTGRRRAGTLQPAELLGCDRHGNGQRSRLQQPQRRDARNLHLSRRRRRDGRQGGAVERRCLGIVQFCHHPIRLDQGGLPGRGIRRWPAAWRFMPGRPHGPCGLPVGELIARARDGDALDEPDELRAA